MHLGVKNVWLLQLQNPTFLKTGLQNCNIFWPKKMNSNCFQFTLSKEMLKLLLTKLYFKNNHSIKNHSMCQWWQLLKATQCTWTQSWLVSRRKKPFDIIWCLYKMKQSHWLLCRNKELWLVKKNHATVKLYSNGFTWNENSQRKQNWSTKFTNVKENDGKIKSVLVIRAALWSEKHGCCLEYWWSWTKTRGKLAVDLSFEWKERYEGGNLCLYLVILNQFHIVSEDT